MRSAILLVLTLFCTAIATADDKAKAIEVIDKLGGSYQVAKNRPGQPIVRVVLTDADISIDDMKVLQKLKDLEVLSLAGTQANDECLDYIANLKNLRMLYLSDTQVTDRGLLKLKGLTRLRLVFLKGTKVTPQGIAAIRKAMPRTRFFR